MSNQKIIQSIKEMLDNAEANIRSARQILSSLEGGESVDTNYNESTTHTAHTKAKSGFQPTEVMEDENRIIEGRFDGQNMIGPDKKSYPVPANYASKSKLVPGDILKLTIMPNGSFLYKQIGPVPRKRVIGSLCYEEGSYKILAEGKSYSVLLASVTYFKAEIGDKVALIIPELEDSEWGAIENIVDDKEEMNNTQLNIDLNTHQLG